MSSLDLLFSGSTLLEDTHLCCDCAYAFEALDIVFWIWCGLARQSIEKLFDAGIDDVPVFEIGIAAPRHSIHCS